MSNEDSKSIIITFPCNKCDKIYRSKHSLIRHQKNKHNSSNDNSPSETTEGISSRNESLSQPFNKEELIQTNSNSIAKEKNESKYRKDKIPSNVRNIVWGKYIGVEKGQAKCFCCHVEIISKANFECGHVEAEAKGGKTIIDNLRPICSHCNKSIGTKNMEEFMESFGILKPSYWDGPPPHQPSFLHRLFSKLSLGSY